MSDKVLFIIILLAMYPVVISFITPILNKKKLKKQEELRDQYLDTIKVKDKVVTISGIYGIVNNINNNIVKLEIAKDIQIEIDKASIMGTLK
ncbi:preprotein translocase subunit YajC [uncultured Clostridium sp.]|uniref:preprotein translocase subunit YajC n=1 Tax=uncultured Clostridium sp. TaxID=59620 RepID=UPI000821ECFB|nr:preprotein translocase subunit YajC [uncultured Clostridium sp.]SCJ07385.1 preprotein translocase subunit YajC [uncultured Clostridium sp.]